MMKRIICQKCGNDKFIIEIIRQRTYSKPAFIRSICSVCHEVFKAEIFPEVKV